MKCLNMENTKGLLYFTSYGEKSHQWPQIFAIFVVSLGSFTCGVQFAWTSPSIAILTSNSSHIGPITLEEASYLIINPSLAMVIISPFIGILLDYIGRKKTVLLMTIPQFFSWVLIAVAENLCLFYISRFLSGIGYAVFFSAIATYVGEIATPDVRGLWGNLITVSMFFGQFLINVIGTYVNVRTTAIIFGYVPLIQLIFTLMLPESPYFLLMKNREEETRNSLKKLRWMENVDKEFVLLKNDVQRQVSESGSIRELFTLKANRKALIVCVVIGAAQHFSGISAFAVYTQYMFNEAGGNLSASISAIIYSAVWTVAIGVAAFIAGKFGRRPLLIFSCMSCSIILFIEATYFYIRDKTTLDVSMLTWLPLAGMIVYIVVSSVGLGIIPNLLLGELFSASIKGKALCFCNISFGIYMLIVPKIFQILSEHFGLFIPFYFFAACCVGSSLFSYHYVPETRGKTLEEIQQLLKGHKNSRRVLLALK